MDTKELRIGNYVWEDYGGSYLVRGIMPSEQISISKTKTTIAVNYSSEHINPIPLTEEWLIKFGKKADISDSFGGYVIQLPNGNGLRIKDNKWNSQHTETKVDFIHQLQNLYFALTGEELTIKE
ncbi:MAG: hypothetical protein V4666_08285 [Bacteroidota bacterium]